MKLYFWKIQGDDPHPWDELVSCVVAAENIQEAKKVIPTYTERLELGSIREISSTSIYKRPRVVCRDVHEA